MLRHPGRRLVSLTMIRWSKPPNVMLGGVVGNIEHEDPETWLGGSSVPVLWYLVMPSRAVKLKRGSCGT
jgi:hypothetical protein